MKLFRMSVGSLLDEVTTTYPEKEALVDISNSKRLSYKQFLRLTNQLAKGLLKLGFEKGEHLALWAPNNFEWIITQFAVAKIGGILISIDTNVQVQELEYILKQSDSTYLVLAEGLKGSEYIDAIHRLCPEVSVSIPGQINSSKLPELRNIILTSDCSSPGMFNWNNILEAGTDVPDTLLSERQLCSSEDDVVTILYTSGTTGAPKGVKSTHFGIMNATLASAENQRLTEKDRLCLSVPLFHMFGCICVTLAAVIKGATLVIPSNTFDTGRILEAIEKEKCTAIYGSPGAFIALMEDPRYKNSNLISLRTGIMGGAQCPMEVMKRIVEEMGVREIMIGYGQTEASSWLTMTRPEDPLELRVSTIGKPLPGVEVKIIDQVSGREANIGTIGEICGRGFNMKGYYKMPAATANAIDAEGWLHTGDLGTMDNLSYFRISGRMKEVINKGGETIYPTEIEEILFSHPKILNAQVIGVPDRKMGEEVAAWIIPEEGSTVTEEEIGRYCRDKLPASHLPRYVKFVKDFPVTPLGKVQKFKMREIAIKEYGLE
ncbi:MAG: AMP-binding protein [Syntrophales bacterium]|nr:AMP-binding protein [Syntrophales bacterium]